MVWAQISKSIISKLICPCHIAFYIYSKICIFKKFDLILSWWKENLPLPTIKNMSWSKFILTHLARTSFLTALMLVLAKIFPLTAACIAICMGSKIYMIHRSKLIMHIKWSYIKPNLSTTKIRFMTLSFKSITLTGKSNFPCIFQIWQDRCGWCQLWVTNQLNWWFWIKVCFKHKKHPS